MKAMKNIRICLLAAMLMISVTAFAYNDYFSSGTAIAVPSAGGKVWAYANKNKSGDKTAYTGPGTDSCYQQTYHSGTSEDDITYTYSCVDSVGYHFDKWYKDRACSSQKNENRSFTETIKDKKDINNASYKYYAHFIANTYTITLDNEGGSPSTSSVDLTYDSNSHAAITNPTKTDYTFRGWYSGNDGTGDLIIAENGTLQENKDGYTGDDGIWRRAKDTTLYAKWAPNYKVAFDKNGGQGDDMANQSFYYGEAAKALSTNTYTRAYTVAYTASDGATCSTSPANTASSYTFDGWATTADGSKAYADGAEVSDLTSTAGATVTLFARWINGGVTLPTATKKDSVLEGWYSNSARTSTYWIGAAGATYYPTADIRLYAKWIKKHTPVFTGPVYVGDYYEMDVDDTYSGFTFTHVSDSVAVITGEEGVISYDKATNTLTANKAGTATIKFTQIENDTLLGGTSDIWSIRVSLVTNNLVLNSRSDTKFVGQEVTNVRDLESQNSNATVQTSSSAPGIAHYDVANNKIVIDNAGDSLFVSKSVTITIWQEATAKYAASGNKTFTLTVNKYGPLFTGSNYNGLKVDDEQTADYAYENVSADVPTNDAEDDFYYTIANIDFDSVVINRTDNPDSLVRYNPSTKQITALNAGECDIVFHQKETRSIYSGTSASYHITVGKWGNTLYANSSASYSTSMYVDRTHDDITLTATNTDYTNCPITVTPTAGSAIIAGTYNEETRKISLESNHNLGTATWAIHQDENYKYYAGDNTFSVTVSMAAEVTNCYVITNESDEIEKTAGNWTDDTPGKTFTLNKQGKSLTFEANKSRATAISNLFIQATKSENSSEGWYDLNKDALDLSTSYESFGPYDVTDVTFLRFCVKGGGSYTKNMQKIYVTRNTWLKAAEDTIRITKTAGNNPVYPNDVAGAGRLIVDHSLANGGDLKIVNSNPSRFTLASTTIEDVDCKTAKDTIAITYSPIAEGRDTARLVIYNDVYRDTVLVTGVCVKRNQAGRWKENISTLRKDTRVVKPFSSTQSGSYGVTYTSTDSTKVDISGDTIIAKAEGSATIYAEVRGDENYYPIRESIDITVTTDHVQYIVWNQDKALRRLKFGDDNFVMNAYATSDIDECETNGPDAETPRPITYTSSDTAIVEVVNDNELKIKSAGTATVTASIARATDADGHTYIAAELAKEVVVRNPSDTCERYSIYTRDEQTRYTHGRNWKTSYSDEFSLGGKTPGFYSMVYKGENGDNTDPEGTITMQEYVGSEWSDVNSGTPRAAVYDTIKGRLNPTATKIRVKIDGKGYLYFKEIDVKRIDYIEVQEGGSATDTLVFSSYIGTPLSKDVIVRSSNVSRHARITLPTGAPFTLSVADIDPRCENDKIDTTELSIEFNTLVGQTDSCYNMVLSDGVTTKTIVLKATATAETVTFGDDGDWTEDDGNWSKIPNENTIATISDSVNVVISTEVEVYSLIVEEGATVTVTPTGGLTIGAGGIIGAAKDSIKIQVSTDGGTKGESGYVRISPEYKGEMPQATIETYTKGFMNTSTGTVTWQYLGSPIAGDTAASKVFGDKTFIYTWDESKGKWVNRKSKMKLEPFKGYAVSQSVDGDGKKITYDGQLVDMRDSVVIELQYTPGSKAAGCNVLANSFAAPIDISRLQASDFSEGVEATINLFNTGSQSDIENCIKAGSVNVAAAGQYLSIPVNNAKRMYSMDSYPIVIPPMQGFYVNTNKAGTLTLNYERLVWNADYEKYGNQPLRAKRRTAKADEEEDEEDDLSGTLKVTLLTESGVDHMYILESPTNVPEYENGYDARKLMSGNLNIFAVEEEEQLAIDATNSLIGTKIGVRTGNDSEFKMAFSKVNSESNLSLLDKEMSTEISIYEGMEYTFYAVPNETITDRFEIVDRFNSPAITTGNDGVGADVNVQKFIKDNSLYIYKDGALYNALGERVR